MLRVTLLVKVCFYLSCRVGIYLDRDAFVSMRWTAHGVKIWPSQAPVAMTYRYAGEGVVRAMPRLSFLLSDQVVSKLRGELDAISISLYEVSFSEQRHVRRIPLKPQAVNLEE